MSGTILHYGIRLALDASIMSKHMLDTLRRGYYENEEAEALASLIQEDEVVMELGGGIGFLSTLLAKNSQVKAVHVFEANPHLIDAIHRTHSLNGVSACVYNEIVGKNHQPVDFYIHEDFWASSTIPSVGQTIVRVAQSCFQSRLDQIKPTLLIVDIEGGEIDVFDNIKLTGVKKILIEIHQNVIGREGVKHVFDTLSAEGFHYDVWHSKQQIVLFSHINRDQV